MKKYKANRVYCYQCLRNGDHVAHIKDQKNLKELIEFFYKVKQEKEFLITKLSLMFGEIIDLITQLNQGLESKYQFSKERLLSLNTKQLNQVLNQVIKYDEIKNGLFDEIKKCSDDMVISLKRNIKRIEIKIQLQNNSRWFQSIIEELNYSQSNQQEEHNVEELYQKGVKLILIIKSNQSQYDNKYKEAIILFEAALLINPKHFNSLNIKGIQIIYKCIGQFFKVIIMIIIDYINTWQLKRCNYMGRQSFVYKFKAYQFIINKRQLIRFNQDQSILRMLGNYNEALKILDQALNVNPNHQQSLASKGACLNQFNNSNCIQSLSKYSEAINYFNKVLQINPDYQWAKNKQVESEKQLSLKQCVKYF